MQYSPFGRPHEASDTFAKGTVVHIYDKKIMFVNAYEERGRLGFHIHTCNRVEMERRENPGYMHGIVISDVHP